MRRILRPHVRVDHVVPHAQRDEDVRGHVLGVSGIGRDAAVCARSVDAERGVRWIVDGVDHVVRRARMIGMRAEDASRNGVRAQIRRHIAVALVESQQRQCVEELRFDVVRIRTAKAIEACRPERVAPRFADIFIVQRLRRPEPRALVLRPRLRRSLGRRRRKTTQHGTSGGRVLLIPHRMRIAHRFAPVRHHVAGIELLRLAKGGGGLWIVEIMEVEHAANECRVRGGRGRSREGERAELRGDERRRGIVRHLVMDASGIGALLGREGHGAQYEADADDGLHTAH